MSHSLCLAALAADNAFTAALTTEYGQRASLKRYARQHASTAVQSAMLTWLDANQRWIDALANSAGRRD